jgi:hypothetical protein
MRPTGALGLQTYSFVTRAITSQINRDHESDSFNTNHKRRGVAPESCALIVTSRRQIALAGVARVDLDLLAPAEAAGLLRSIVGDDRATEPEQSRIAELSGFLPLALRVAGMFLAASPHWSAAEFIGALADERERLARLKLEGSAALDVAASLALSVRDLRRTQPDLADRWHELAVFPAGFDTIAAAAVWDQPVAAARDAFGVAVIAQHGALRSGPAALALA